MAGYNAPGYQEFLNGQRMVAKLTTHSPTLQAYVDRSHSRLIAVLPLRMTTSEEPNTGDTERDSTERHGGRSHQGRPIGALIVEQLREASLTETLRTRAEIVAHHSAGALANAIEHSSLFLLPVWKTLGQATWLFRGRTLPKTLLAVAVLLGGICALAIVQTDFEVAARGKLR